MGSKTEFNEPVSIVFWKLNRDGSGRQSKFKSISCICKEIFEVVDKIDKKLILSIDYQQITKFIHDILWMGGPGFFFHLSFTDMYS
jgi:hypothetical protein